MIMVFFKKCCLNVIVVCIFVTNSYKYTLFISKRFMLDEMTQNNFGIQKKPPPM